jgi:hypothetical protein
MRAADVVIVVKRCDDALLANLRASGKPWVFDAVDFYPQPICSTWTREQSVHWVREKIAQLDPTAVIWPNQDMRDDCSDGRPAKVLYHHHRPEAACVPFREQFVTVGYEGSPVYLDSWRPILEKECEARGLRFVVNPGSLAECDCVVALRAGQYNGYAQHHWKSNVKLANAHGYGVPFIGQRESGYMETMCGAELLADTKFELRYALDVLSSAQVRKQIRERFLSTAYTVEAAGADLMGFLHAL